MNRRPPDSSLAIFVAANGESSIPVLLEKLENEKDEQLQYGIIDIFEVMSTKGYLRGKANAIMRIRQVVLRIKIQIFRDLAQQSLDKIERDNAS